MVDNGWRTVAGGRDNGDEHDHGESGRSEITSSTRPRQSQSEGTYPTTRAQKHYIFKLLTS